METLYDIRKHDSAAEGVAGAKTPLITLNATGSNYMRMSKWIAMVAAINEHLPRVGACEKSISPVLETAPAERNSTVQNTIKDHLPEATKKQ